MNEQRIHDLIDRYLSCGLEGDDRQSLERALLTSPPAREAYWRLAATHADMREWGLGQAGLPAAWGRPAARLWWQRWATSLGSSAAAAAALVLAAGSILAAGVAWAIVPRPRPMFEVALPVADAGFEAGVAPATQPPGGCSLREMLPSYGAWAADGVRITGPEHGLTPREGKAMLCFEEALPAPGATVNRRSEACDLFQFVDLRPWGDKIATGEAMLELSMCCAEAVGARDVPAHFHARIFAYDSSPADVGDCWPDARLDTVALNQVALKPPAADGAWRRLTAKMLLPPTTRFVLLHITAGLGEDFERHSHLGRQYCDDVRLTLTAPTTDPKEPDSLSN